MEVKFNLETFIKEHPILKESVLNINFGYESKKRIRKENERIFSISEDTVIAKALKEIESMTDEKEKLYNLYALCSVGFRLFQTVDTMVDEIRELEAIPDAEETN